jgi:hypothetical protein
MTSQELSELVQILNQEGVTEIRGLPVTELVKTATGSSSGVQIPPAKLAQEVLRHRVLCQISDMMLETAREVLKAAIERGDLRLFEDEAEALRQIWGIDRSST